MIKVSRSRCRKIIRKGIRWNECEHDKLKEEISKVQRNEILISGKLFDERKKIRQLMRNIEGDKKKLKDLKQKAEELKNGLYNMDIQEQHVIEFWSLKVLIGLCAVFIFILFSRFK